MFLKSGSKQYKAARAAVDKANNVAPGAGTSPSNAMNNDMYTIGNVWLAELKYRSAVSRQMDDWVKNGSVLQFNFIMAKDAERQRRLRLRQYLHMTIQKQKSVFTSIEDAHKDALYDLWMNGPEDEYDNVNFDDDSNSITCMSSTNHSTESSSLFADIDKEMEMQLNEMMKQYNEHDTRAVLFDHPSLSKCPTMLYQKRLQLKEEKENMLRQKKKQEKQHQQKLLKDFTYENDDDSDNDSDNADDDKFNPKNIDSMLRTSGTIQERIQRISEMSGSTTFWNPLQQSQNDPNNNNSKQLLQGITASIASNMVDLSTAATSTLPSVNPTIPEKNQSMESSNNDDKTASSDGKKNDATATPSESNSTDVTTISKEVVSSSKSDKDENKTRSKRTKSKPVDPQKQVEEDMDRLLYSGALLESHYVQYAAVVEMKLEENDGSVMYTTGSNNTVYKARPGQKGQVCIVMPEDEAPNLCLAVVTTDETLHLFDLPEQVTEQQPHASLGGNDDKPNKPVNEKKSAISTSADSSPPKPYNQTLHLGSAAEDALQMILLHKQEHDKRYDKKLVEPESTKSPEISPKRNRLRLTKLQQQQSEEQQRDADVDDSSDFGLTPFLSMHLNEYTVRMTRRGEFALKITKNFSSYGNSSTASFNNNGSSINNNSSTIMTIGENSDAMIGDDNTKRQLKVRLKVSSRDDQLAIVSAARGQLTRMEV